MTTREVKQSAKVSNIMNYTHINLTLMFSCCIIVSYERNIISFYRCFFYGAYCTTGQAADARGQAVYRAGLVFYSGCLVRLFIQVFWLFTQVVFTGDQAVYTGDQAVLTGAQAVYP